MKQRMSERAVFAEERAREREPFRSAGELFSALAGLRGRIGEAFGAFNPRAFLVEALEEGGAAEVLRCADEAGRGMAELGALARAIYAMAGEICAFRRAGERGAGREE